ncbi:MAG TPA: hypothetical protein VMU15_10520 [Anaeromyxobacter sp.]|nr:hypothetical protein [Anaeromyxobacter sp.]
MRWLALLLLALALTAGCDVKSFPPAGFPADGAALVVNGGPLRLGADQAAAVAGSAPCAPSGAPPYELAWGEIIASNEAGVCGLLLAGEEKPSRLTIRVLVALPGPPGSPISLSAGAYPVAATPGDGTGPWAMLSVLASDTLCRLEELPAVDGLISLTAVESGHLQGTVEAFLAGGGTVLGTFGVDLCAATLAGDACAGAPALASPTCAP